MVDGGAALRASAATGWRRRQPDALSVGVEPAGEATLAAYEAMAREAVAGVPQSVEWVSAWIAATGAQMIFIDFGQDGRGFMTLALEVVDTGGFRIARFPGGRHAIGNFPVTTVGTGAIDPTHLGRELKRAIASSRPDIDLLVLERQHRALHGMYNPLGALSHSASPDIWLAVDLNGGFEAVLERAAGTSKRKRHRSRERRFERAGGFRRIEANTPEEVRRLLGAFFEMKAARFRQKGIPDAFCNAETRRFFETLFVDSLGQTRKRFQLHGLEVGGILRAVTGSSLTRDRMICEFSAISDDEMAHNSPGEFLFFRNIEEACENGLAIHDFSIGDEPYKRLWCSMEGRHFDNLLPLTAKGRLGALSWKLRRDSVRLIKSSGSLRELGRRLRRWAGGRSS